MQDDDQTLTIEAARARGQVIDLIAIDRIDANHLVRDRMAQDEDDLQSLMSSIRQRGQQMPIEVVRLGQSDGVVDFGLISGWRRVTALRRLHEETGEDRFAVARALVVEPSTAQDAYLAMVEENEIRVDLSHYERARIALKSIEEGVFPDQRAALRGLYGSTTRSKRSKIGTFIGLVQAFDNALKFPTAISEKLGLALAREMVRDPGFVPRIKAGLRQSPHASPAQEMQFLVQAVTQAQLPPEPLVSERESTEKPSPETHTDVITLGPVEGLKLRYNPARQKLEVSGEAMTEDLARDIADYLRTRL